MTISNTPTEWPISINGVSTIYNFDSLVLSAADLEVLRFDQSGNALSLPAYTVTGLGNPAGGSVVFATVPPVVANSTAFIRRKTRQVTLGAKPRDFIQESAAEREERQDQVLALAQEGFQRARRTLQRHPAEATADFFMPAPAARRGKALLFADTPAAEPVVGAPLSPGALVVSAYIATLLATPNVGALRGALGLGTLFNVKWYGALGDGVADDTSACNAAAAAAQVAGGTIYIPLGTYRVKNFRVFSNTIVLFEGAAKLVPADTVDLTSANNCVQLDGDNIHVIGGRTEGVISGVFGVEPAPYTCMQVFQTTGGTRPVGITVRDHTFIGGRQGLIGFGTENFSVVNCVATDQYWWGVAMSATGGAGGPNTTKLLVDGLVAERVGLFEGLKVAALYQFAGGAHSDIQISNVMIRNCGRLDPDSTQWQEGLDLFVSAADRIRVSNFNIVNCGNGGIEVKRNDAASITPNSLSNVQIANGYIGIDHDSNGTVGIALNWTANNSASPNTARQVMISLVTLEYTGGGAPVSSTGINVSAFTDVRLADVNMYGPWSAAVHCSPNGTSSDSTVRRLTWCGGRVEGAQIGFTQVTGVMDQVELQGVVMATTNDCVAVGSTTGSRLLIEGGRLEVLTGNARFPVNITSNITEVHLRGVTLKADGALFVAAAGGGKIDNCELISAVSGGGAISISGGTWHLMVNDATNIADNSVLYVTGGGTIHAWGNRRRPHSSAPSLAGTVGEFVPHTAPAAGGVWGYVCTSAAVPGSATWKGVPINA